MSRKFIFSTKKEKKRLNFFECGEDFIDSQMVKGAHIEMFFNKKIIVDGCHGVFEYSNEFMRLNLGKGSLMLFGKDFDILAFEDKVITIKGEISSIEFCV